MSTTLCNVCGTIGLGSGGDGFYYCLTCGTQSQDLVEQGLEDEGMAFNGMYNSAFRRKTQSAPVQSQAEIDMQTQAEALAKMQKANMTSDQAFSQRADGNADSDDETLLRNYGFQQNDALDGETLASQLKERYLEGVQMMIEMQCEVLVKIFGVSPLICGVFGPIWLRFVASTRVLERGWAYEALQAADALYEDLKQKQDGPDQDYGKDLCTYLKYCNEVIFAGSKMSYDEENIIKHFWKLYEKLEKEDLDPIHEAKGDNFLDPSINSTIYNSIPHSMDENNVDSCQPDCNEIPSAGECSSRPGVKQEIESAFQNIPLRESSGFKKNGNRSLESIISDMEQNGFHYIRPTRCHPPDTYLVYRKKIIGRKYETLVHADYYILLRACARVIKVNVYALHSCVLNIEKRLSWIEGRITGVLREKLLTEANDHRQTSS